MSEGPKTDLQFERAEFSGGAEPTACTTCRAPIRDTYYEVDGQVTCDRPAGAGPSSRARADRRPRGS